MIVLLKAFKTEIDPTKEQIHKIQCTMGTCRFIYNFYIIRNKQVYAADGSFLTANAFSKWLNNEFLPGNPKYSWMKDVSSKAVKQAIRNGETAFKRFFKGLSGFPKFKKKRCRDDVKIYFPRNNRTDFICERHRIKVPTLGWVRLKEKGYLPTSLTIRFGTVSRQADRYYLSVLAEVPGVTESPIVNPDGIGIDLGIKTFATCSNGMAFKNIDKDLDMRRLLKKLRRMQRACSRKYEQAKKEKFKKGKAAYKNLQKDRLRISRLYRRIAQIWENYRNQCIAAIVKTKPSYVALEDLNIKGIMANRHLSRAISRLGFYTFRTKLTNVCRSLGIEVRIINRWYPSSKTCSVCGQVHKSLKLSDRTFVCPYCGHTEDRDFQAARNIRDCEDYRIA